MKIQALGVCRFSMISEGGYKQGPADTDARAAFLFDPRRLAIRFAWFEHVLVPSIRNQDDDRFRFVVLTSDRLPKPWADRLQDIVAPVPTIEVDFTPPGPHHQIANDAIHRRIDPEADVVAQFRLDDDDGLARSYVSRVHSDMADGLAALYRQFGQVSCDYVRGLVLEADGTKAELLQTYARIWSCGQTLYTRPGARKGLFTYGHHRHHRDMPTVMLQDEIMFVRGRHSTNDSPLTLVQQDTKPWDMEALPKLFGISLEALQSALRAADRTT